MGLITLNNEQKLIQNEMRKFAYQEIEPIAQDIEKDSRIPEKIFKKLAELGLLTPIIPAEYGGAGMDSASLCIILEELSKSCASLGLILAVNNGLAGFTLLKVGREKFNTYLNRLAIGEIAGFSFETTADQLRIEQQVSFIINGTKRFVFNGELANFYLLIFNNGKGLGLILVEREKIDKITKPCLLGMKSAGIADLSFFNLQIPESFCLMRGNDFINSIEEIQRFFHLCLSAIALGISQAALESAIKYSKGRKQFNRPICEFPMVQEMLAEMKIRIESSRNLVYDAAMRFDAGEDYGLAIEIAFTKSSDTAVYCGIKSVQVFGGYGYTKDYPVERYLRDAKTLRVLGLNTYELKERIARYLLA
ncbi:MAG: acyl-CoA dehydrogenase family protein [candidate division WOR-3 bacterium]|nr:acyl-CoA dehydrogenase family protein [candidate division WOR-3 bacterium]